MFAGIGALLDRPWPGRCLVLVSPSHGENRGSSPLGSANYSNELACTMSVACLTRGPRTDRRASRQQARRSRQTRFPARGRYGARQAIITIVVPSLMWVLVSACYRFHDRGIRRQAFTGFGLLSRATSGREVARCVRAAISAPQASNEPAHGQAHSVLRFRIPLPPPVASHQTFSVG